MSNAFTTEEFLEFAKSVQNRQWTTLSKGTPFIFAVEGASIRVQPSTGTSRKISNTQIAKFCKKFNETGSLKASEYSEHFNKSYLLPLADCFNGYLQKFRFPAEIRKLSGMEGASTTVFVNRYERDPKLRARCIEVHGTKCKVCSFDFQEKYGKYAAGFIHVHHLDPLSECDGEHEVDPVSDLRPVCPNCHAVIHLHGRCLTIEEAMALITQ